MGNRAVITLTTTPSSPCIYLHWNGGRASVEGFLAAARSLGKVASDAEAIDRLYDLGKGFFAPSNLSCYRETYGQADTDNWDNGTYIIDRSFAIIARDFQRRGDEINVAKTEAVRDVSIYNWLLRHGVVAPSYQH